MKKIGFLSLFLVGSLAVFSGVSFAENSLGPISISQGNASNTSIWEQADSSSAIPRQPNTSTSQGTDIQIPNDTQENLKTRAQEAQKAQSETEKQAQADEQGNAQEAVQASVGITINSDCMGGVGCSFSAYDTLGIRKDRAPGERTSVMLFVQDIILGASMFIGTVVTVAFIVSGLYYVFSAADASYKKQAKDGMKYAIYGLVIVLMAIVIVRLVQFLARGGS